MSIQRNVTLTLSLSKFAEDFGFKVDFDEYEDVYHEGYKKADLKNLNLNLPDKYKHLDKEDCDTLVLLKFKKLNNSRCLYPKSTTPKQKAI